VAVDQCALEAEILHRALQLGGGFAWILHRHRGETAKARAAQRPISLPFWQQICGVYCWWKMAASRLAFAESNAPAT
jgi:hypothetical protein